MNIPEYIKKIADSKELFETVEKVALVFTLNIDQTGELDAEIRSVLLGIHSPKDFTKNISKTLEVDEKTAEKITAEVNRTIFSTLKEKMQDGVNPSSNEMVSISSLEKVGNFSIEESDGNVSDENTVSSISDLSRADVTVADRDNILSGIENPAPAEPTTRKINVLEKESPHENIHTDPIIDHLLSNPVATEEKKVEKVVVETSKIPTQPIQSGGMDKYREPIE